MHIESVIYLNIPYKRVRRIINKSTGKVDIEKESGSWQRERRRVITKRGEVDIFKDFYPAKIVVCLNIESDNATVRVFEGENLEAELYQGSQVKTKPQDLNNPIHFAADDKLIIKHKKSRKELSLIIENEDEDFEPDPIVKDPSPLTAT